MHRMTLDLPRLRSNHERQRSDHPTHGDNYRPTATQRGGSSDDQPAESQPRSSYWPEIQTAEHHRPAAEGGRYEAQVMSP
jgi:hypothetical protein